VEYGPTTSYGSSTTAINAGDGIEAAGVRVQLAGLEPGTRYYARLAAQNELTTTVGSDVTFTSLAATGPSAWSLPDGRAYEMVSPLANARGNVYVPDTGHIPLSHHQTSTRQPLRASADGNAVTYAAAPPESGGNGSVGTYEGNDFLATRGADGWTATDIMPPTGNLSPYRDGGGFSSDLSVAVLRTSDVQLTPDAPLNCEVLYSRTGDGAYHAAFTSTQTPGQCGSPQLAGLSANNSSIVFESEAALTPEAVSGSSEQFFETVNLYDSVAGRVYLVNVLPNGKPVVNAAFGGVSAAGEELREPFLKGSPGYHHYGRVISADGTRIVWTDLNTGNLYVRENPAGPSPSTVQVDASVGGGGQYRGASSDGSKVFFTKSGHLYVYDLKSAATNDLTPAGGVLGVTGVSEDGSYVYLVAESLLASNENANSEQAQGGQPNLYLRANGNTTFVAVLSARDNKWIGPAASGEYYFGDWRSSDKARTAEVAPDGRHLVFMSTRSLTGYDNSGGCSLEGEEAGCPEVFMYDAGTRRIFCASCNPSGEPPGAELRDPEAVGGAFLPSPLSQGTYQLRWMSNDGNRVFFDSSEPLVPQDTNGVQDVYEWERAGTENCSQETDCIYLISSNLGSEDAFLVDASASGNDVFFTTRAQLVPADRNENVDLYDARVEGGFAQAASACSGSGCQGTPSVSPTFPTPSTASFEGSGNFPSPPVAKPLTRQKLKNALRRCRQVPMKRRRARCEARARRRYGAKSSATRRLHRRGTKK